MVARHAWHTVARHAWQMAARHAWHMGAIHVPRFRHPRDLDHLRVLYDTAFTRRSCSKSVDSSSKPRHK
eukprot:1794652-Pleurochrysis_carterae.AAC.1